MISYFCLRIRCNEFINTETKLRVQNVASGKELKEHRLAKYRRQVISVFKHSNSVFKKQVFTYGVDAWMNMSQRSWNPVRLGNCDVILKHQIFLQGSSLSVYKNKYTFFQLCHMQKKTLTPISLPRVYTTYFQCTCYTNKSCTANWNCIWPCPHSAVKAGLQLQSETVEPEDGTEEMLTQTLTFPKFSIK